MNLQDHIDSIAKVAEIAGKEYSLEQVEFWAWTFDYLTHNIALYKSFDWLTYFLFLLLIPVCNGGLTFIFACLVSFHLS